MKALHEERKAKMRAYYRANKDKWKKYNREELTRMSDDEKEAYRQKQREYQRAYYQANRDRIIARTSQYHQDNADKSVTYRANWYQTNKARIAARRRYHYHIVVKPRQQAAKEASQFLSIREAVTLLGAKLRAFREWVYQGRIEAVRTPGGRYLLRRDDVEHIRANCRHFPSEIRERLGLDSKEDTQ